MTNKKRWIWQQDSYPNFTYDKSKLESLLLDIKYQQGLLDGIYKNINKDDLDLAKIEILTTEAIDTSAIEGEILSRDSVRSSIAKKLGISLEKDFSNTQTDGLVDILLDATLHYDKEFTLERLFGWHNALFPTGYNSVYKINVAQFRGKEDMQVVSGPIGKEKVHYVAPTRDILESEMNVFLQWINDDNDSSSIIKAAIAHLWFVVIHPMDDGNGRIARALTDMLLARESKQTYKMYSISNAIKNDKKNYYDVLERTTSANTDITVWLEWFLQTLLSALYNSKNNLEFILQKTRFWDKHRETILNERQIKVLNKLLDVGVGNFTGGINTRKYASMTKVSKPTASREIKDLVQKACLVQVPDTAGRNISYDINVVFQNGLTRRN